MCILPKQNYLNKKAVTNSKYESTTQMSHETSECPLRQISSEEKGDEQMCLCCLAASRWPQIVAQGIESYQINVIPKIIVTFPQISRTEGSFFRPEKSGSVWNILSCSGKKTKRKRRKRLVVQFKNRRCSSGILSHAHK